MLALLSGCDYAKSVGRLCSTPQTSHAKNAACYALLWELPACEIPEALKRMQVCVLPAPPEAGTKCHTMPSVLRSPASRTGASPSRSTYEMVPEAPNAAESASCWLL